ncbi:unnamed protein product (mitochondrion) [Plasmodiophora brassicae]|uniref:Uncharacterized protein n=1 Tax=Plasmodiophora brassicae TaxID=37360 RepID=A0A3P3YDS7_PLABS|nr:unnamed protein product [Plasmodiophora brassicae]
MPMAADMMCRMVPCVAEKVTWSLECILLLDPGNMHRAAWVLCGIDFSKRQPDGSRTAVPCPYAYTSAPNPIDAANTYRNVNGRTVHALPGLQLCLSHPGVVRVSRPRARFNDRFPVDSQHMVEIPIQAGDVPSLNSILLHRTLAAFKPHNGSADGQRLARLRQQWDTQMHHLVRRHADASFPDFPIAIAQLTNEVAAPRDDRDHLRNRRGNVEASKDECNRLRRDVMRQQSKIADLNSDVAGLQTERERQFADLVLLNLELPKAKGGCARLRQDRTEQARRIKMLRQHIIRIEGQREQLRANMTRLNGQVKAFEGDRNAIRAGTCRQALKATKLDGTTVHNNAEGQPRQEIIKAIHVSDIDADDLFSIFHAVQGGRNFNILPCEGHERRHRAVAKPAADAGPV